MVAKQRSTRIAHQIRSVLSTCTVKVKQELHKVKETVIPYEQSMYYPPRLLQQVLLTLSRSNGDMKDDKAVSLAKITDSTWACSLALCNMHTPHNRLARHN